MSCVASASERFEENLGQPLVFLDGMAQGFDVGFLGERFGRFAHLTTKRMKYAAVIRCQDIFGDEPRDTFGKASGRLISGRSRSCRGAPLVCTMFHIENNCLALLIFQLSQHTRLLFASVLGLGILS